MSNSASTRAVACCTPARFLVASGARRGERSDRRQPPRVKTPPRVNPSTTDTPDRSLSRCPPEAAVDVDLPPIAARQEPTRPHTRPEARVEDDRRKDDERRTRSGMKRSVMPERRKADHQPSTEPEPTDTPASYVAGSAQGAHQRGVQPELVHRHRSAEDHVRAGVGGLEAVAAGPGGAVRLPQRPSRARGLTTISPRTPPSPLPARKSPALI